MTSLVQFLLIAVISTLTFLIALVAIQVLHILHDARQSIAKFNQWLDANPTLPQTDTPLPQTDRVIATAKKVSSSGRFFHRAGSILRPTRPS